MGSSRRARAVTVATVAALVAAASALAAGRPDPLRMTLRLSDLPPHLALVRAESGRYDIARAARTDNAPVSLFRSHGYLTGYELDATRQGSLSSDVSAGLFQIIAATSLWQTASGARWSLARSVKSSRAHGFQALPTGGRIGAESHLYSYPLQDGNYSFQVYALGWRDGPVRATVLVAGAKSAATARRTVRLARKQERRIAAQLNP
jgi:hypothetical protein